MAQELYFADTLVSVKYNKTLKTLPLRVCIKALPPLCMKYTARNESRVANIA